MTGMMDDDDDDDDDGRWKMDWIKDSLRHA